MRVEPIFSSNVKWFLQEDWFVFELQRLLSTVCVYVTDFRLTVTCSSHTLFVIFQSSHQQWHMKPPESIYFNFYGKTGTKPALIFHLMRPLSPDILTKAAASCIYPAYCTTTLLPFLSLSLFLFHLLPSIPFEIRLYFRRKAVRNH